MAGGCFIHLTTSTLLCKSCFFICEFHLGKVTHSDNPVCLMSHLSSYFFDARVKSQTTDPIVGYCGLPVKKKKDVNAASSQVDPVFTKI